MAISTLRPSYAPHARVALRLLATARSQASIAPGDVTTLSPSHAAGRQDESPLHDGAEPRDSLDGRPEGRRGDPHGQPEERPARHRDAAGGPEGALGGQGGDPPAGLVTMAQLGPEERLRAAEEAYGYSRHALGQDSQVRLGESYDTAS